MSEENVEIVRRYANAFNRRDVDGMLQFYDPMAEVDWSRSTGLETGIYRGHEAIRDFWSRFLETWERVTASVDEFIDCGESVVLPSRTQFWGRDGIEVEAYGVFVATLRDGRIVVYRLFHERADALKALGLEE